MQGQPNSPYSFDADAEEPSEPYVSPDEVEETDSYDPEERDVIIVDGEAMSYRAYHRR